jgi:TRAP transporter TAXI family solute receptor
LQTTAQSRSSLTNPLVLGVIVSLLVAVGATWFAVRVFRPTPPHVVVVSTGPEGSAYQLYGEKYREILAREGIELRLVPSAGAVENLQRLRDGAGDVSVAFVESGIGGAERTEGVQSLGTVFYEPLWPFVLGPAPPKFRDAMAGKRVSIGPRGSGTNALCRILFDTMGMDPGAFTLVELPPREAAAGLLSGELGAAVISSAWDSPVIQDLLHTPGVTLLPYPRVDALVAIHPFLSKLVLPMGVADLKKNIPAEDTPLIAATASLAVREDLHPAIQFLLLDAMTEIHARPGILHRSGAFPAPESIDLPLSPHARQFYKSGRPFLQRFLPFWLAVLVGQLLVLIVPMFAVLYPPLRGLPTAYKWWMRRRVFRLYRDLKEIESELWVRDGSKPADDLVSRLDRLDEKAHRMRVPSSVAQDLYNFKSHVIAVRDRLHRR